MFTPVETTVGALLLHQATSTLLYQNGNILGLSGYLRQLLSAPTKEQIAFFTGMAASYVPLKALAPQLMTVYPVVQLSPKTAMATAALGALIGWGTKMANGCTSGHMLCGLSRLSGRSATAVAVFFPTAMITHHLANPTLATSVCPSGVPCYTPVYPKSEEAVSLLMLAGSVGMAARTIPHLVALATSSDGTKQEAGEPPKAARITTQFFSDVTTGKVAAFLSFPALQHWDPSLGLVIIFGVLPNLIENQIKGFKKPPSFAEVFALPTKTVQDIDKRFLMGAVAFGIGWGLSGVCPGPAVIRAFYQPIWVSYGLAGSGLVAK
ncbi:YeeE/YedE family integral membrane protein [Bipolaris maydis]|nr:YeeE/YedE family integral membrane protein [Bipolaris maydis]